MKVVHFQGHLQCKKNVFHPSGKSFIKLGVMDLARISCSYKARLNKVGRPAVNAPYSGFLGLSQITMLILHDSLHSWFIMLLNHIYLCQAFFLRVFCVCVVFLFVCSCVLLCFFFFKPGA